MGEITKAGSQELAQIESGLKAFEERKKTITELVDSAKVMSLTSHSYKEISAKRKELKAERVSIEKDGKSMRDLVRPITLHISEKEKELVTIIDPEEERLSEIEKAWETEQERIKQAKLEEEMKIVNQRIEQLAQYGAAHDVTELKLLSDIAFENILNGHKEEWEAAEAKRIQEEEENKKALEELAQMKAKEEVRKRRIETRSEELRAYIAFIRDYQAMLEMEDDEYAKEFEEIKAGAEIEWQAQRDEQQRIAKQQQELEEKQAELDRIEKQRIDRRVSLVVDAGLMLDPQDNFFKYEHIHIHLHDVKTFEQKQFEDRVAVLRSEVEAYKAKVIQNAIDAEQKRIAEEKAAEEEFERIKADAEAKKEAKRLAKMPDAKRLTEAANEILFNMPMPPREEMKTEEGVAMWDQWKKEATDFQARIIAEINNKL